jgi:predicted RNA-binding Zn ribbon-like protein
MNFAWTPHRFAGGALALDVANSVILRFDAKRRTDRFAEPQQLAAFAGAAETLSSERAAFAGLVPVDPLRQAAFIDLREKIDAHFRHRALNGNDDNLRLADLLGAIAATMRSHAVEPSPCPVDLATARSALRLVSMPEPQRLKICPNCGWLFVDMSRNRSRNWCDMNVCGNRAKARLHYHRKTREDAP